MVMRPSVVKMQQSKRKAKSIDLSLQKRFIFLGQNSGIQGLGHLFRENAPFFARLFWLLVLLASLVCLYILLVPQVARGAEVSYTAETRYLPWTTTFPAVTVCETYNSKYSQKKLVQLYPELLKTQPYAVQRLITDVAFNQKTSCLSGGVCNPCGEIVPCDLDWRKLIENARRNCSELLTDCKENGKPFPCCEKFRQVDSETGPCYSYNTLHGENPDNQPLYSVNRSTGPGMITFHVLTDVDVSVHSTEELSTIFLSNKFKFKVQPLLRTFNNVEYTFSLVEFENDPMLENEEIDTRGCRYLHEVPDETFDTYKVYSYGACKLAHETEHSYKYCGCVHPCRDLSDKDKYCNFNGLVCLINYETQKSKLGLKDHDPNEMDPCLPSCEESELTTVHLSRRWVMGNYTVPGTNVTIQMAALPSLRYQRNLLRTDLDLVVSVGGLVGLFFGASILSLVEILYLFLRKQN